MSIRSTRSATRYQIDMQHGIAVVALLFALSIFSVLSMTVLRNPAFEAVLRTSDQPDLHVVLYTGGAGSPQIVGRLNIPTIGRQTEREPDLSAEIRTPGPIGIPMTGELGSGLAYAVQIAPGLRVCCDGGDGACRGMTWDQEVQEASLTPPLQQPLDTIDQNRTLRFSLSSGEVADNVALDPNAVVESPFLIRAARIPEWAPPPEVSGPAVSCRLVTEKANLAVGTIQLRPGVDSRGRVTRVSSGSIELTYRTSLAR